MYPIAIPLLIAQVKKTIKRNCYFRHWKVDIEDPGWAGAWFVGFLLQTLLALLIAIPLLGLPKRIKGKAD